MLIFARFLLQSLNMSIIMLKSLHLIFYTTNMAMTQFGLHKLFQAAFLLGLSSTVLATGHHKIVSTSTNEISNISHISASIKHPENGEFIEHYQNGHKKLVGHFKNGLPDGAWSRWFENGNKLAEVSFIDGKMHGVGKAWYQNGKPLSEKHFNLDVEHGSSKAWYANGQQKHEIIMKNGEPTNIITWDKQGNLTGEFQIIAGKKSGVALNWYDNHTKRSERIYEDNELVSEQSWDMNGNLIQ